MSCLLCKQSWPSSIRPRLSGGLETALAVLSAASAAWKNAIWAASSITASMHESSATWNE
ncbi:hypothetical protein J5F11_09950, partial [Lactobacillus delbrueckii subsp. bulgaricus]